MDGSPLFASPVGWLWTQRAGDLPCGVPLQELCAAAEGARGAPRCGAVPSAPGRPGPRHRSRPLVVCCRPAGRTLRKRIPSSGSGNGTHGLAHLPTRTDTTATDTTTAETYQQCGHRRNWTYPAFRLGAPVGLTIRIAKHKRETPSTGEAETGTKQHSGLGFRQGPAVCPMTILPFTETPHSLFQVRASLTPGGCAARGWP